MPGTAGFAAVSRLPSAHYQGILTRLRKTNGHQQARNALFSRYVFLPCIDAGNYQRRFDSLCITPLALLCDKVTIISCYAEIEQSQEKGAT